VTAAVCWKSYKSVLPPHLSLRGRRWIERQCGSRATRNLYSVGKIYIVSALRYCMGTVSAFWVKLGTNDLNCAVKRYSLTHSLIFRRSSKMCVYGMCFITAFHVVIRLLWRDADLVVILKELCCAAGVESAVPDAVTLTQSSDDAAVSEASDLLRSVVWCCRKFLVMITFSAAPVTLYLT